MASFGSQTASLLPPVSTRAARSTVEVLGEVTCFPRSVPAATDGAFKVLVMKGRLELLPFPRGKKFQVELDMKELTGRGGVTKVEVVAVDEGGKELARVPAALSGDRLTFEAGVQGAVRYSITY